MRNVWKSFLTMSTGECATGAALGVLLSLIIVCGILQLDYAKYFWYGAGIDVLSVVFCIGVIAWARIQPPPDIDNRPESKREP